MDTITTAPAAAQGQHRYLRLTELRASPLNHRKTFHKDTMAKLAESIRSRGVLEPIMVRPIDVGFEVVFGERRFRAAKDAGLVEIPAILRTLTDLEVLEMQVIENGQREDPHPLEEADGYDALMKCPKADGTTYTADEIAVNVGQSRSYIYGRLKLCSLCPEARKAFYEGELDASRALLIARIAHHDTQRQALKDVTKGRWQGDGPMSYREAHEHIVKNFMLQLKTAPFDIKDAELVAKAGACGPCPKRTGNQADLFGDVKSADVCTDPKCFDDKRQAHYRTAAVQLEAQGFKVIAGDAAKKVLPHWEHDRPNNAYINLAGGYEKFSGTTYAAGNSRPVKSLFDKDYKPAKLQHPLTGEIFDVVTQQAIAAAVKKLPKSKKGKSSGGAARPHREPEKKPEDIFRERLFVEILKNLPANPGRADLQLIADDMIESSDGCDEILADHFTPLKDGKKHDGASATKALKAGIADMSAPALTRLCLAVIAGREVAYGYGQPKDLLEAAKRYKVDPAKVKKAIADEAKAAAAKEAEAKATAKKGLGRGMPAVKEPKKGLAALGIESAGAKKLKAKK
jgi:ParB/RepB/Spo0J family partition protein